MLWGLVAYFNPAHYSSGLSNYRKFSCRVRRQGLKLFTIELVFPGGDFEIRSHETDKLLRLNTETVLWHKERLFNIALGQLPDDCTGVCWLDGDILFESENWVEDTKKALDRYAILQPFDYCVWLPPGKEYMDEELAFYPEINQEGGKFHSFGFAWHHFGRPALKAQILFGHVGFAWAARRDVLEQIGMYDAEITGNNDMLMAHGYVGCDEYLKKDGTRYPAALLPHFLQWARRAERIVAGSLSYVPGTVFHLWHGSAADRNYKLRLAQLRRWEFDPSSHLETDENGLYRWSKAPEGLVEYLVEYFAQRKEDHVPQGLADYHFKDGFYNDEGGFRWSQAISELVVTRNSHSHVFELANNVLGKVKVSQKIDVLVNQEIVNTIRLYNTNPVEVSLKNITVNDQISFVSDVEFSPADWGEQDRRRLSFMFLPKENAT